MQTPKGLLSSIQTRGDFRALNERSLRGRPPSIASERPSHPIWEVWKQIKSAYPGPTTNWEEVPPDVWAYAIDDLSAEQIGNGIRALGRRADPFPPSAGEFREMCTGGSDSAEWEHKRIKPFAPDTLLEKKRTPEETAFGLDAIQKIMAGQKL